MKSINPRNVRKNSPRATAKNPPRAKNPPTAKHISSQLHSNSPASIPKELGYFFPLPTGLQRNFEERDGLSLTTQDKKQKLVNIDWDNPHTGEKKLKRSMDDVGTYGKNYDWDKYDYQEVK